MGQLDYVIIRAVRESAHLGNGSKVGSLAYNMAHLPLHRDTEYLSDWKEKEKKKVQNVLTELAKAI